MYIQTYRLPWRLSSKEFPCNAGDVRDMGSTPWVGKIAWRGACQPTPVFLPVKSHGQSSLVNCGPWGCFGHHWSKLAHSIYMYWDSQVVQTVKNLPAKQETWVRFLGQDHLWKRKRHPTPVFLPWESHGKRNLAGYSHGFTRVGLNLATKPRVFI